MPERAERVCLFTSFLPNVRHGIESRVFSPLRQLRADYQAAEPRKWLSKRFEFCREQMRKRLSTRPRRAAADIEKVRRFASASLIMYTSPRQPRALPYSLVASMYIIQSNSRFDSSVLPRSNRAKQYIPYGETSVVVKKLASSAIRRLSLITKMG